MLSLIPEPSQELTVPRNCSELKTKQKITSDGEYKLGLQYPFCNNTVDVYCADMNTSTPKEYITLKTGDTNNYSKKNYVSSVKSSIWASARTNFAKVTKYSFEMRINFSYLNKLLNWWEMVIYSACMSYAILEIFRLLSWYANDLTCDVKRFTY